MHFLIFVYDNWIHHVKLERERKKGDTNTAVRVQSRSINVNW
jgi:hypothetical protein